MSITMHERIRNSITRYIKNKTGLTVYNEEMLMTEIGINSIEYVELIVVLEDEYSIEFNTNLLLQSEFESIKKLIDYIEKEISMHKHKCQMAN